MKIIILAGGGGSRLFPLSRKAYPKQFLCLEDEESLLAHTVRRFLAFVSAGDIVVVTGEAYLYHVQHELFICGAEAAHVVLEPTAHNTAPAIALAAKYCEAELGCSSDEVLLVVAADHVIRPQETFMASIQRAEQAAKKQALVVFGVKPTMPATGYGYIEAGRLQDEAFVVKSFKEKPSAEIAERYVREKNFYWNSGMFAFTLLFLLEELERYAPDIFSHMQGTYAEMVAGFSAMPDISIDYALAEKSQRVRMIPLTCYWNDIGSWDAMYDIMAKDDRGNATRGNCLLLDCDNSLVIGRDRLIAGIGLDDLLLVETDDVIVVTKKGKSQRVKEVVTKLKEKGRKEAIEHTTTYHAWGSSTVLEESARYRMKKLRVLSGHFLSMQLHYHRSEHWIVLAGTAQVVKNGVTMLIHENESIYIPPTIKHRLGNPGKVPLDIIEVQNGAYIGEDDIVRFEE